MDRTPVNTDFVKLFVGMLSQDPGLFAQLNAELRDLYGPSDFESPVWKWEHSDYYEAEMGHGLKRQFFFYQGLIRPDHIAQVKLKTIELEKKYLSQQGGRKINLDPGYMDSSKIVLVSTKNFSHRIYLGSGIFGEVPLIYSGKAFQILPYTYPDFRTQEYLDIFGKARELYKEEVMRK
jgi:hypothetical protein